MASQSSAFLNVRDLEKSVEFYQALGFEVAEEYFDDSGALTYVDLDLDGAELSLGQVLSGADEEYARWVGNPELGAGVILYFTVPDVDTVWERARGARATIEVPLRDRSYGRAFNLNDPDGYVVCFMTEKGAGRARPKAAAKKATSRAKKR